MKQIGATKFRKQCLSILDRLDDDGIVITKRGKPVAKLIPVHAAAAVLIGSLKGRIKIKGDILETGAWGHARRRRS